MIHFAWKYPGEFKPGDVLLSNGDMHIIGIIEGEPLRGDDDKAYFTVHDLRGVVALIALALNEGVAAYATLTEDEAMEPSKVRGRTVMKKMKKSGDNQ